MNIVQAYKEDYQFFKYNAFLNSMYDEPFKKRVTKAEYYRAMDFMEKILSDKVCYQFEGVRRKK